MRSAILALSVVAALALSGCGKTHAKVEGMTPGAESTVETLRPMIFVEFDREMDPKSLSYGSFTVTGSSSGKHRGQVSTSLDGRTAMFAFMQNAVAGETLTVHLTKEVKSRSNKELMPFVKTLFVSENAVAPGQLVETSPRVAHPSAPLTTNISLEFSTPGSATAYREIVVTGDRSGAREVVVTYSSEDPNTLNLELDRPGLPGETMTVAIQPALLGGTVFALDPALVSFTGCNDGSQHSTEALSTGTADDFALVGDFNRDGSEEVVVVEADGTLRLGASVLYRSQMSVGYAVHGDFDADGWLDVALLESRGRRGQIVFAAARETGGDVESFNVAFVVDSLSVGHFNADGRSDLFLLADDSDNGSAIVWGGDFMSIEYYPTLRAAGTPVGVDLNDDDLPDLCFPNASTQNDIVYGNGAFDFFTTGVQIEGGPNVTVGNFNGDSRWDLVTSGESDPVRIHSAAADRFVTTYESTNPSDLVWTAVDFNGDGRTDLVGVGDDLETRMGTGLGTLTSGSTISLQAQWMELSMGDLNGDGQLDYVGVDQNGVVTALVSE